MATHKMVLLMLVSLVLSCRGVWHPDIKTVTVKEGETVSLGQHGTELPVNANIYWYCIITATYTEIVNSVYFNGVINTTYYGRAKDRLQLDRHSGFLTIKSATEGDSGFYKMETEISPEVKITELERILQVYAAVSEPMISPKQRNPPQPRSNCTVVCSVRNGREVALSWYRGNVSISSTSSPDLGTNLSLSLSVNAEEEQNWASYSCVASNPASQSKAMLTPDLCSHESSNPGHVILAVFCFIVPLLALTAMTCFARKKRKETNRSGETMGSSMTLL